MKLAVFANTPAQVHFYKHIIKILRAHGHEVKVLVRDYGETLEVVESIGNDFYVYSKSPSSKIGKVLMLPYEINKAYQILRKFKPDVVTGFGIYDAFSSAFLRTKCVIFEDSEPEYTKLPYSIPFRACLPFADAIITPYSFRVDIGKKQIRVNSFKELAYLHPNYYKPDESIKMLLGVRVDEDYVLLRFNAFDAVHDFGIGGFSVSDKIRLVDEMEKYARVFISSEAGVPEEIKDRTTKIPKSRIHDAIYYAKLLVSDTQTMTTEAAILGTPAIRCNHFVGNGDMSNFIELERYYELIYNFLDANEAIERALELIQKPDLRYQWNAKQMKLLYDKIDITQYMVDFLEHNYRYDEKSSQLIDQLYNGV